MYYYLNISYFLTKMIYLPYYCLLFIKKETIYLLIVNSFILSCLIAKSFLSSTIDLKYI
jgi:hypothetical protein